MPGTARKLTLAERNRRVTIRRRHAIQRIIGKQRSGGPWTTECLRQRAILGALARSSGKGGADRSGSPSPKPKTRLLETLDELMRRIPDDAFDNLPTDLSVNVDHYLYGAPKRE